MNFFQTKTRTLFSLYIILNWKTLKANDVLLRCFVDKRAAADLKRTTSINHLVIGPHFGTTFLSWWDHIYVAI